MDEEVPRCIVGKKELRGKRSRVVIRTGFSFPDGQWCKQHVRGVLSSSSPLGRPCRYFSLFKLQNLPVWCLLAQFGATEPQLLDFPNKRNIEVGT